MPADVFGKLVSRRVAFARLLAKCFQHDVVKITRQAALKFLGGITAQVADELWSQYHHFALVLSSRFRAPDGGAGSFGIGVEDGMRDFMGHAARETVGAMTGEQFIQNQPEG